MPMRRRSRQRSPCCATTPSSRRPAPTPSPRSPTWPALTFPAMTAHEACSARPGVTSHASSIRYGKKRTRGSTTTMRTWGTDANWCEANRPSFGEPNQKGRGSKKRRDEEPDLRAARHAGGYVALVVQLQGGATPPANHAPAPALAERPPRHCIVGPPASPVVRHSAHPDRQRQEEVWLSLRRSSRPPSPASTSPRSSTCCSYCSSSS